jgi:hypothetical protein
MRNSLVDEAMPDIVICLGVGRLSTREFSLFDLAALAVGKEVVLKTRAHYAGTCERNGNA